ncbi:hypothetical protein MY3957_009989 [Beauveria namnaoensis]
MISLTIKGPILGCWLVASLALGSPEYSDNYSSSLVGSQPGTLSSSVGGACRIESTKTIFVTLGSASKLSTESAPARASVGTTTIIVSPVQSQVKTDLSVDAATTDSVPAYEPTMGFSSHSETGHPTSEISSLEYSTISRTVLSTRTVTLTVAPAGKGSTSSARSVASDVKGTGVSSSVTESPLNVATRITHTVGGQDGRSTVVESIIITEPAGASTSAIPGTAIQDNSASVTAPGIPVPSYVSITSSGLPVHTSFTAIGPDGSSTIIDTTWIIPVPPTSLMSGLNPLPSEVFSSGRIVSGLPAKAASEATSGSPITSVMGIPTCTTVTVVGPDMRPTVTELTIIAPTGAPTATTFTLAPPSFVAPASMTNLASQPPITSNSIVTTITWKVIGADGTVSPIIQTITAPSGSIISDIPASLPAAATSSFPQPAVTVSSGNVPLLTPYGTFDNVLPGPLLNPAGDLWFSEGFLVAPPSSPPSDAYLASSGNQLLQFMPLALVPDAPFDGAGDTAEIGVGPNEISPCFRFNFYGASLGCAAEGVEQWCEFEFSAYTYNETLGSETSLDWSETKRVPACSNFPQGPCSLIPVQLDGYNDLTSILITVRVGLELRAWWGDDFHVGWTDNTCEAASCRSSAISRRAKREAFSRASRRGVWQWTPNGAKKLDDDYVWSSFK